MLDTINKNLTLLTHITSVGAKEWRLMADSKTKLELNLKKVELVW